MFSRLINTRPLLIATLIICILIITLVLSPLVIFDHDGPLSLIGINETLETTPYYIIEIIPLNPQITSSNSYQLCASPDLISNLKLGHWEHKLRFGKMHLKQSPTIAIYVNQLSLFLYPDYNLIEASQNHQSAYYRIPEDVSKHISTFIEQRIIQQGYCTSIPAAI